MKRLIKRHRPIGYPVWEVDDDGQTIAMVKEDCDGECVLGWMVDQRVVDGRGGDISAISRPISQSFFQKGDDLS